MKQILIILLLIWSFGGSYAQNKFTLSLELVKPSGHVDAESYFLARLKNQNDSLSMFVGFGGDFLNLRSSYFRVTYEIVGEPEYMSNNKPFFDFGDKHHVLLDPSSEYQVKLPLFYTVDNMGSSGILPLSSKSLRKIKKLRIKLEKFEFVPMMIGSQAPRHFYPKKSIDLYSNWMNINGEEFIPILEKAMPRLKTN